LGSRCFKNIVCTFDETSLPPKAIKIWPNFHIPKCGLRGSDLREYGDDGDFVTLEPMQPLEVRHEVPRDKIDAAKLQSEEVYKAEMTDLGLATRWWMYGTMDYAQDKKFMRWSPRGVEGDRQYILDNMETLGEPPDDLMWEDSSEYIMGGNPRTLGIVIEKGEAEFEVV
jgi:hypothetical protein